MAMILISMRKQYHLVFPPQPKSAKNPLKVEYWGSVGNTQVVQVWLSNWLINSACKAQRMIDILGAQGDIQRGKREGLRNKPEKANGEID